MKIGKLSVAAVVALGAAVIASAPAAAESRNTGPVPATDQRPEARRDPNGPALGEPPAAYRGWRYRRVCRIVRHRGHRERVCRLARYRR